MSKNYESEFKTIAALMLKRLPPPPPVSDVNTKYNLF